MSIKALDNETHRIIYTKDAVPQKNYSCCTPECTAIMRLRRGKTHCFFALESQPHIRNCDFANYSNAANYELPTDFTISSFIEILESAKEGSNMQNFKQNEGVHGITHLINPKTPKQLYEFCQVHSELYSDICIDSYMDSDKMIYYGFHGINGGKIICGYIDKYIKNQCLVIAIKHLTVPNRFLNISIRMNSETYQQVVRMLLKRAERVLEAKVIICSNCINEITVTPYFRTRTTAILKSTSQVFAYLP